MSTKVEKRILVNVPVSVAYNQWTQFEEFPHFMGGVKSVKQLSDDRLEWVAEIAGVRRQWQARILEQIPDRKVAWAATEGATNAGSVTFEDLGGGQTSVQLSLEYEPEGIVEKVGDKLNVVENQAESDLNRFKDFIEDEGYATGAWRGTRQRRRRRGHARRRGRSRLARRQRQSRSLRQGRCRSRARRRGRRGSSGSNTATRNPPDDAGTRPPSTPRSQHRAAHRHRGQRLRPARDSPGHGPSRGRTSAGPTRSLSTRPTASLIPRANPTGQP